MTFTESVSAIVERGEDGLLARAAWWERVPLGCVCQILNGFPFASAGFNTEHGTPVVRIRDVVRGSTATYFRGAFEPVYLLSDGDLLVGMDGDFNVGFWRGGPALLNQRVCRLTPIDAFYSRRLLGHVLPGYLAAIHASTPSVTVKHLSSKTLGEIPLPLPPRGHQDVLAATLDSYLSRLDEAEAALERVERNLKRYRAAVLQAAVTGKLVPTEAELARAEGRAYEPAEELLKRVLAERRRRWEEAELAGMTAAGRAPRDRWRDQYAPPNAAEAEEALTAGWCCATIDQLADVGTGATPLKGEDRYWKTGTVPWVTSAAVNSQRIEQASAYVTEAALAETNLTLYPPGTLVVAMYGEGQTRGRVSELAIEATTNQALAALVLQEPAARRAYLRLFLTANYERLRRAASGGVQPNLNLGILRSTVVALPPLAEQDRIVAEADRLLSVADEAAAEIKTQRARIARLRQSILKWAFEGRLVDQDPNDEPVSVLMERIRAERGGDRPQGRLKGKNARGPKGIRSERKLTS